MANTALRITELDFSGIRTNLINFLKQQDTFTDYDFTGSGLSVLIDILAYNTHMNAYYLNMVANEAFLDTAQLRSSVISHAKHIDYVPGSMKGAQATVNLIVTPQGSEDTITGTMTLPKYTRFISEPLDGISYIFTNTSANTAIKNSGAFTFPNIVLTQGEIVTQQYSMGNQTDFSVPSSNVDTSTITVTVQESSTNTAPPYIIRLLISQQLLLILRFSLLKKIRIHPDNIHYLLAVSYTHLRAHETGRNLVCR